LLKEEDSNVALLSTIKTVAIRIQRMIVRIVKLKLSWRATKANYRDQNQKSIKGTFQKMHKMTNLSLLNK